MMPGVMLVAGQMLGQGGGGSSSGITAAVGWILALTAAVVVLGLVLMRLRRVYLGPAEDDSGAAMPVAELRKLRDTGELSEEEFQRAVAAMAERAKAASAGGSADTGDRPTG